MRQLIVATLLFFTGMTSAQDRGLFFEIAGSGGLGSINYERFLSPKTSYNHNLRIGFSVMPIDKNNGSVLVFPVIYNALIGNGAHKAEMGIGQTFSITTKGSAYVKMPVVLGYRYTPEHSEWYYRVAYTPIIGYIIDRNIQHWAGISFGKYF